MTTPKTEAGKRLAAALRDHAPWCQSQKTETALILAAEAEAVAAYRSDIARLSSEAEKVSDLVASTTHKAVAAYREALAVAVEGLPKWDKRSVPGGFHVSRAAVLDLIRGDARANPYAPDDPAFDVEERLRRTVDPLIRDTEAYR